MDDAKFGGITALSKGIVVRVKDGYMKNIFYARSNNDLREQTFDVVYADKAPAGQYGLGCRRTFNGQEKNGVTIRLDGSSNDQLQIYLQDNLTGLTKMSIIAQGHVVE